ncbi:arylsulfatase [Bythopirellula goksoeyrii]|uniref:arylsulfatase n=1 Tax=Bythopirellula goksoeyrii TaxID=1400387 RepID=UPI001EE4F40D|nr:arylsulfatase [Bythopirellula goksoeyrii]
MVILADDLGYSDLGCYGSEISTPNLDALAENGLKFTQFYNCGRCWPTRASLLSGYYPQQVGRDALPGVDNNARSRGKRPSWARLLPHMLKPRGYRSYHSGKWHIDGSPMGGGFDHSYYFNDYDHYFTPTLHYLDDRQLPAKSLTDNFYATTVIADYAIEFLKQHEEQHPDQPFFEYLAFIAPHFPLQAPAEDIARYQGRYGSGWDELRKERWVKIQKLLGLPGELSSLEPEIGPPYDFPEAIEQLGAGEVNRELAWDSLTTEQQEFQAAKMEIHAAMVDRMDREIGRVIDQIREMGQLDNTVILFFSDNGGSAEIMVRGDGHDPEAMPGSQDSFLCLGPGWSSASNTPFRRHKTWVHEGGIATPLVVHWPDGIHASGELRHTPAHVIDLAPTIVGLAGGEWPSEYADEHLPPNPGRNLAAALGTDVIIPRDALWWYHEGNRALRKDNWKIVAAKGDPWELYDLGTDRAENHDLAEENPEMVKKLKAKWIEVREEFTNLLQAPNTKK